MENWGCSDGGGAQALVWEAVHPSAVPYGRFLGPVAFSVELGMGVILILSEDYRATLVLFTLPLLPSRPPEVLWAPSQLATVTMEEKLAFTSTCPTTGTRPLLLVTDTSGNTVHMIDIVTRAHVGFLEAPGRIMRGASIASAGEVIAMTSTEVEPVKLCLRNGGKWSSWKMLAPARPDKSLGGYHARHAAVSWDGTLIAFRDGMDLYVTDSEGLSVKHCVALSWFADIIIGVREGWAVVIGRVLRIFDYSTCALKYGPVPKLAFNHTLTVSPCGGVMGARYPALFVCNTLDVMLMNRMSAARVAWMSIAARAIMDSGGGIGPCGPCA